jgi:Zn-dependent peptidase ImmA (M78 family)
MNVNIESFEVMPTNIFNVKIKRGVFDWLINTSGWSNKDLADKLNYPEKEIAAWRVNKNDIELPINKVEILASAIKRPLSVFFISKPPVESSTLVDFRKLTKNSSKSYSKETALAIRKTTRLQKVSHNLLVSSNYIFDIKENEYQIQKISAEDAAIRERQLSSISIEDQISWRDERIAFREWKEWLESKNMFVFQMDFPIEDARGFSLIDIEPYIIVLSSHDSVRGRIFSLFHEYAHILLRKSAVCNMESYSSTSLEIRKIERWCDSFAGAFILPMAAILRPKQKINEQYIATEIIRKISSRYKISELGVLVRLGNLRYIENELYRTEYLRLKNEFEMKKEEKQKETAEKDKKGGGQSGERRAIIEKGMKFSKFVIENSKKGKISEYDVMDYLDIQAKNLPKLHEALDR